jgi:hypothetical protein
MKYQNGARIIEILEFTDQGFIVRIIEDSDPEIIGHTWEIPASELASCYNAVERSITGD